MPINEMCYFSSGENRKMVTIDEALAYKDKHGGFTGGCTECGGCVSAHHPSEYGAAHFQHIEGNEHCSLSAPHR
jgi:hypothetical protein